MKVVVYVTALAELIPELAEIEAVVWSILAPVAVIPAKVPESTYPPAEE